MLVLTRKVGREDSAVIQIGEDIKVTVLEIRGEQVRLGITAPDSVAVWRRELWDAKQGITEHPNS